MGFEELAADLAAKHHSAVMQQYHKLHGALVSLFSQQRHRLKALNDHQRDLLVVLARRLNMDVLRYIGGGDDDDKTVIEAIAVRLVDYCREWRAATGAIHNLHTIMAHLSDCHPDMVLAAVRMLQQRGYSGFEVIRLSGDAVFVQSAPLDLVDDDRRLLEWAHDGGIIKLDSVGVPGWTVERMERAVRALVGRGVVWWDCVDSTYWIASKFV